MDQNGLACFQNKHNSLSARVLLLLCIIYRYEHITQLHSICLYRKATETTNKTPRANLLQFHGNSPQPK